MKITKTQLKQIIKEELEAILDEVDDDEENPDDIIARYPDPEGKNPDQVIYRWQQDEFDRHQAAWKDFMKRNKK
jgi:hypothetical protein